MNKIKGTINKIGLKITVKDIEILTSLMNYHIMLLEKSKPKTKKSEDSEKIVNEEIIDEEKVISSLKIG